MIALVGAFNQEKALVGAFSVIVQPVVEPMDRFTALIRSCFLTSVTSPPPLERMRDIARDTAGYSGSDLTLVCREATLAALREAREDTKLEITAEMLRAARQLVKPSAGDQRRFLEWNKKCGTY